MGTRVHLRKLHQGFTLSPDLKVLGHARKVFRGEATGCANPCPAGQNLEPQRNSEHASMPAVLRTRGGGVGKQAEQVGSHLGCGSTRRRRTVFRAQWEAVTGVSSAQPSYLAMFAQNCRIFYYIPYILLLQK